MSRSAHSPLRAIRAKCLDCSCFQPKEVRTCSVTACPLYDFRMGRNPYHGSAGRAASGSRFGKRGEKQGDS